jgi:hypothetical protein
LLSCTSCKAAEHWYLPCRYELCMFNWHGVRSDAAVYQRLSPDAQQAAAHGGRGDLRPEQQETRRQVHALAVLLIRIRMFLGFPDPDPDPVVRGTDPAQVPSIIKQK